MKKFLNVLLWIVGILILLLLIGFLLPRKVLIERTATIKASPQAVYGLVNNLTTYDKWMPWNQIDSSWKVEYASQTSGAGAWYKWYSKNDQVGNGKLSIDESVPYNKVTTKLEFEGFDEPSMGGFELQPAGNDTQLKWYMTSDMGNNPVHRWMGLLMNQLMGPQFDKGLANIAALADRGELQPSSR